MGHPLREVVEHLAVVEVGGVDLVAPHAEPSGEAGDAGTQSQSGVEEHERGHDRSCPVDGC